MVPPMAVFRPNGHSIGPAPVRPTVRTIGPPGHRARIALALAEPPPEDGGPNPRGESRTDRDGEPNAEPDSSPRRPNGLLRGTRVPGRHPVTTLRQRAFGRNLALDLVAAVGVGVTTALVDDAAADDRPARRPRADRPGRAGGRAVRRQPAGRLRRPGRAADDAPARAHPGGSARRRCWSSSSFVGAAVLIAVTFVFWLSLLVRQPVPPPPVGRDVPGPGARPGGRLHGIGRGGSRRDGRARRRRPRRPDRRADRGRAGRARRVCSVPSRYAGLRAPTAAAA